MTNTLCLDENYSTTTLLTKEKPEMINKPEDKFETVLFLPESEGRKGEGGLRTKGYFKKSYDDKPLISIITVVYNGEKYLDGTIQSVINQTYDNVEYIIIDGGSTDGTIDIIKKYEDKIDYWISECDRGIYDAMNKGICTLIGNYVLFINADDVLFSNETLQDVIPFLNKKHNIFYGKVMMTDEGLASINELGDDLKTTIKKLTRYMCIPHQATFYDIDFFKKFGLYSLKYKIVSDYEILLRNLQYIDFSYFGIIVSKMRNTGISINNHLLSLKEFTQVKLENSTNIQVAKYQIKTYYLYKFLVHKYRELFMIKK